MLQNFTRKGTTLVATKITKPKKKGPPLTTYRYIREVGDGDCWLGWRGIFHFWFKELCWSFLNFTNQTPNVNVF